MKKISIFLAVLGLLLFGCVSETVEQCGTDRADVCGSDGVTYTNACYARAAGATVAHTGACGQAQNGTTPSENCADSDNGKNALEYGITTKGTESFNDSCSPTANAVYEYFCSNNAVTSELVPCPAGTECAAGKCGELLCSDSDNGKVAEVKGTAKKGGESSTDNCTDGATLKEYYCSDNTIASASISCGNGKACEDGACVVAECTDTDGGFNLYEKGSARGTSGITYVDVCSGGNGITEYYCSDGNVFHTTTDCGNTYTCTNGICIESKCRDTDAGQDENFYGSVYVGGLQYNDGCYDEYTVTEYYCSGTSVKSIRIDCDSDERCANGECTTDYCTDSDGGKDKDEYGTVEVSNEEWDDYCLDGDTVREYYCLNGAEAHTSMDCDSGEVCSGGECVVEEADCTDTDGGKDLYTKGTTKQGAQTGTDYCTGDFTLKEYYCSSGDFSSDVVECEHDEVCTSGKCVEAECFDSDGGKDYLERGTVTKGQDSSTDTCHSRSEVQEYYCSSGNIASIIFDCGLAGCDPDLDACVEIVI